jgi:ComF family protein
MVYGMWDALFVESCPACGLASRGGFCAVCAEVLPRVRHACARCGLARPVSRCPLRGARWPVAAVVGPFDYAPPLDHYVHALKYRGARSLGRALALLVAPALTALRFELDALVPVPLHRARRCERGYNQACEIARPLARELGLPLLERGIARRTLSAAQTGQTARQRRASVASAFAVSRDFAGLRVAIVDDVVTTGATVNALAAEIERAGARRCIAVAVARTPERDEISAAKRVVEHDACEHGAAEPGVVQERTEGLHAVAVADQVALIDRETSRRAETAVEPNGHGRAAADEHEAREQQHL